MAIKWVNSPLQAVMKAVKNLFPTIDAKIIWNPNIKFKRFLWFKFGACGYTLFPDNPKDQIEVHISTNIPFGAMIETLAHELAHVAVGETVEEHGEEWENAFSLIHEEYNRLIAN